MFEFVKPIKENLEAKILPGEKRQFCIDCNKKISKYAMRCVSCAGIENNKERRKVPNRPSIEQLKEDLKELPMTKVGLKYGVSDNCIRKWIKTSL
jgi:hypothetical protein